MTNDQIERDTMKRNMTTTSMIVQWSTVLKIKIALALLMVPLAITAILVSHYQGPTAGLAVGLLWCVVMAAAKPADR